MIEFTTKDIDERNAKIAELYHQNIKYTYTGADSCGVYHITYESID